MRILVFTTLFPHAGAPHHGVFVENRLRAYLDRHDADVRVVAPAPWFPFNDRAFGAWAQHARAPARERRAGVTVTHPRYRLAPKLGRRMAPAALTAVLERALDALEAEGWTPDLLDAHYFYPDGVAAARVAKARGLPLVITARGSDVTALPEYAAPRRMIRDAARAADKIVVVAEALKAPLTALGAPAANMTRLRNGVDLDMFRPLDREKARARFKVEGFVLASVGHLIERKGHHHAIAALLDIPDATLLIVGDGPARRSLTRLARRLGVGDRVRFLGRAPHRRLGLVYSAADALILASSREGWPNVLLEAMACGAPVIASDVWGAREIVRERCAGRLCAPDASAVAAAVADLRADPPDRTQTRAYAERHSWEETADAMHALFTELSARGRRRRAAARAPLSIETDRPRLLVTVDTEEQFDWDSEDFAERRIAPPSDLDPFQALCAARGARPLYFVASALCEDEAAARALRALASDGAADLGLHPHIWRLPAAAGFSGRFHSYQKNLPLTTHRAALGEAAGLFARAFGFRARAHRAGRYGVALETFEDLAAEGLAFDFSPSPGFDFSADGGPDFTDWPFFPERIETAAGPVFVTPVSGARAIRRTRIFVRQPRALKGRTAATRLSPEGANLQDMMALAKALRRRGARVFTLSLHSTSLTPGATPYAPSREAVEALLRRVDGFLEWFCDEFGGAPISLDELTALYRVPA